MANEYALAPDHDNVPALDPIDEILVAGKRLLSSVEALGEFDDGEEFEFLGGNIEDEGDAEWDWKFASMWPHELDHFRDTYLDGKRHGPVTVRTRLNGSTYQNFNATLSLPKRGDLRLELGGFYRDVIFRFRRGVAL